MSMIYRAIAGIGLAAALTLPASAQTLTLKMAHIYTPGNIWYETAEDFAKRVAERSGGKIKIDIAHSGSTGDWPQSIEGLLIGTNDIVLQSVGTLDRYNTIAGIEAYPYLVRDRAGRLHLGYTHRRRTMRHLEFDLRFARSGGPMASDDTDGVTEYREGDGGARRDVSASCDIVAQ